MKLKTNTTMMKTRTVLALGALLLGLQWAGAQGTGFTYQGRLLVNGTPANGSNDFQFRIYTDVLGGSPSGPLLTKTNILVTDGLVNLELDFGANVFTGGDRWLQISHRSTPPIILPPPPLPLPPPPYTNMVPRVHLTPTPYAIFAGSAATVASSGVSTLSLQDNSITAAKIASSNVVKSLNGLTDFVNLAAGSNVTVTTTASNIFISATGGGSGIDAWLVTGNAGTSPVNNYIGASDAVEVRLHATGGFLVDNTTPAMSFGNQTRQMLNLWDTQYGIGVQGRTLYQRSAYGFAWHRGGIHADGEGDPGLGGVNLMFLDTSANLYVGTSVIASNFYSRQNIVVDSYNENNGTVASALTFGYGSGEGIGSKRTAGGNLYGLDFYTDAQNRLSIASGGNVGIGTTAPVSALHVNGTITADKLQGSGSTLMILTTNNQSVEIKVKGLRAMRIEPGTDGSPNIIGGSLSNYVQSGTSGATISGGGSSVYSLRVPNVIASGGDFSTIGGGEGNSIGAVWSVIGGGGGNRIQQWATDSTISGGYANAVEEYAKDATIGGGLVNRIQWGGEFATISGGFANVIGTNADAAVIAGGWQNTIESTPPNYGTGTIGGGYNNTIQSAANHSTIAGGRLNVIQTNAIAATIGGGNSNAVKGLFATVPGGASNYAGGNFSFAAGQRAKANHPGAFVWADSSAFDFSSNEHDTFSVRATKGARFVTLVDGSGNPTKGVSLDSGGVSWGSICDRNAKKNFQPVDGQAVLEKLVQMPVQQWNYKGEDDNSTPHLGPMAQDFKAAFFPGRNDKVITTLEFDGVELAAIQGLNWKVEEKETQLQELNRRLESETTALRAENAELKARFDRLEKLMSAKNGGGQ